MCGIFGVVFARNATVDPTLAGAMLRNLYQYSKTRGSEAAGLTVANGETIDVFRQAGSVERFLQAPKFAELIERGLTLWQKNKAGAARSGRA